MISRVQNYTLSGLPRFNMPLELGIFLGAKKFGDRTQKSKQAMILDNTEFRYRSSVSDLSGVDIQVHSDEPEKVIPILRNWLATVSRRQLPGPDHLLQLHRSFRLDLPAIAERLGFGAHPIPYVDFERITAQWIAEAPPV